MAEFICERDSPCGDDPYGKFRNRGRHERHPRGQRLYGKDKIIKFAGCYHGHTDAMLVSAGSGVMTSGVPDSAGVPKGCTQDTMIAVYNDLESVERTY